MKQSILTEDMEPETIEGMAIGEEAYTLSWAMYADPQGYLWANGSYPITPVPRGTSKMKIKRVGDGLVVFKLSIEDETYSSGGWNYVGAVNAIPVELK